MTKHSTNSDDFETWVELASSDPEKFEQLRQDKISKIIENAPKQRQQRLRGLQWRIDIIREKHKDSAMEACLAISGLMWDTFEQLTVVLKSQADNGLSAPVPAPITDNIITFPAKT
jgi:hypothetical protein